MEAVRDLERLPIRLRPLPAAAKGACVMSQEATRRDVCSCATETQDRNAALEERLIEVAGLSEIFKALTDETRTKILYLLSFEEMCVCDLAEVLDMSMPAISHHLRLLRTMRLVKYRRDGKMVYYSLDDDHVLQLIKVAQAHFSEDQP